MTALNLWDNHFQHFRLNTMCGAMTRTAQEEGEMAHVINTRRTLNGLNNVRGL